jgi:F0F1-type ATP synthase assembly protein I
MDRTSLRALGLVSGIGFAIAIPLGLLFLGGLWLDERLGTQPLFMMVGILLGLIAAGATIAELLAVQSGQGGRVLRRRPRPPRPKPDDG